VSSILFGLTVGVTDPDEVDQVLEICRRMKAAHPDLAADVDELLGLVIKTSQSEI